MLLYTTQHQHHLSVSVLHSPNTHLNIYSNHSQYLSSVTTLPLLHTFNGLFSGITWASQYQKGKTSLILNETRDDRVLGCSDISWTICKQSAPRSRQITTPTPHRSIFTCQMLFLTPSQQCQCTEGQYNQISNKRSQIMSQPSLTPLKLILLSTLAALRG